MVQAFVALSPSQISALPITPRTPGKSAHSTDLKSRQLAAQTVAGAYDGDKQLGNISSLIGHSQVIALKSTHENSAIGKSFRDNFL